MTIDVVKILALSVLNKDREVAGPTNLIQYKSSLVKGRES
jgi:hypothetical protein